MTVASLLESNRVQELEQLLQLLHPRILRYVLAADAGAAAPQGALGSYHEPQFLKELFTGSLGISEQGLQNDPQAVFRNIDRVLQYSVNTWHPGFLDKLYASNNPIGVVGDIVLSLLNTNSHVYTVSPVVSVIENYVGRKYAARFFPNHVATCGGLTFPGGLWLNITAMHMARALRFPATKTQGNGPHRFAVFTSRHCHYSVEKAAILLGLGSEAVFKVAILGDGTMDPQALDTAIGAAVARGFTPLLVNATAGTTVFGLFDDLRAVGAVARKHNAWFHVDGSWGGNVVFSPAQARRLAGCELADSVTANPHKMLGVPNTCLFLLVPHVGHFQTANSLSAPYLFHGRDNGDENMDLADGTMGCGRRPDAFKFYLTWLYYGTQGLQRRVDHAYAIVADFVGKASRTPGFRLVQQEPQCLQVCFYYVPAGFAGPDYSAVTRHVSRELHRQGRFLMDFSPNPSDDTHGEFFRVVFNSPILTDAVVDDLIRAIVDTAEAAAFGE
ncbi:PLP-dependent transferase [Metschnikowia bicuspidata var. bicuspidata NRRL YB-4993]|uniref:PLP-dependent transferase n=1 Tax=Metschnikowia bicuspidata var. bicuspidata NRRL YB-4993 TaxID=869754 RepID=A0A1A0HFR0_9ASCO|nr:PLP-dependent transferase [Metschnikowia bicuspidata var. bicuspidata NRRL YB-4993]OBA22732.1 PLP-dependent transferase [Metschnikowia bicuspidata var. bicuspidata NRRL YB-4993]